MCLCASPHCMSVPTEWEHGRTTNHVIAGRATFRIAAAPIAEK